MMESQRKKMMEIVDNPELFEKFTRELGFDSIRRFMVGFICGVIVSMIAVWIVS